MEDTEAHMARLQIAMGETVSATTVFRGMTTTQWLSLYRSLVEYTGGIRSWTLDVAVSGTQPELTETTIADGLADIYRDLRAGLVEWDTSESEAHRLWALGFRYQWGAHALDVLRALHELTSTSQGDNAPGGPAA